MPETITLTDQIDIKKLDYLDVKNYIKTSFNSKVFDILDVLLKRELYVNKNYLVLVALVKVYDLKENKKKTYIINYNTNTETLSRVLYG